jgi:Adenylate and Guanylate cyclase catalytic domain
VAIVFAFTIGMFAIYDWLVERRQKIVLHKAAQSTAIVSSLFPKQVRDRLLEDKPEDIKRKRHYSSANQLKNFLSSSSIGDNNRVDSTMQMADLFPHCTVSFCDIVGFTAWSSSRQPDQVFILLQTIYNAFDNIAKRRRVFKVETIGDCYLAVTGLPEPQTNHAMIMARFAYECRHKMRELARDLSVALGPGTSDLTMKFGMHSGPVTAGSKFHIHAQQGNDEFLHHLNESLFLSLSLCSFGWRSCAFSAFW